jgi:hypothetical protein
MFQLKQCLECLKVSQTHDSIASAEGGEEECLEGLGTVEDEDVEEDVNGICDGKPESGNHSIRARFGCKHTHNEELCVGSCGVLLGRVTFYGSEAPNGVQVSMHIFFPKVLLTMPIIVFLDESFPHKGITPCRTLA